MRNAANLIILSATLAILLLSFSAAYSAWVASNNHHNACARNDRLVTTMHDVIVLFFTPGPGELLTAKDQAKEDQALARIELSRC